MCKPETLHHNEQGYVSWCRQCGYLSLAFGTLMAAFQPEQIEDFVKALSVDETEYAGKICIKEKAFVYSSDSRHVKFVLNYSEVINLKELLNTSLLMYQVKRLIDAEE